MTGISMGLIPSKEATLRGSSNKSQAVLASASAEGRAEAAAQARQALALAHAGEDHAHDENWEASVRGLLQTAEAGARGELAPDTDD